MAEGEMKMQINLEKYEAMLDRIAQLETAIDIKSKQVNYALELVVERDDVIYALRAKQPHWISVKDRLPEHDGEVLACCGGNIFIANCPEDEWVVYFLEEGGYSETCHVQVDYWMPLPEPPEMTEKKNND